MLVKIKNSLSTLGHELVSVRRLGSGFQWKYEGVEVNALEYAEQELIAGCEWTTDAGGWHCRMSVANAASVPIKIFSIRLEFLLITETCQGRFFFQSHMMNDGTALLETADESDSSGFLGWSNLAGTCAVVAGFLDHSRANTRVKTVRIGVNTWRVTATVFREGVPLAPDDILEVSPFRLQTGPELSVLLEIYAKEVSTSMGRRQKKPAEGGWCSWYHFYGKETFRDVISCAGEFAASPLASSLRTIQIDDGWNREVAGNFPQAWGDWTAHPDKFPAGMAAAACRIHELGFRAGLWLAPFAVARKSRFFVEHQDWLVRQRDPESGKLAPAPVENPDIFQLDCTNPEALDWLRDTFRRVFFEWNFDYVKIDFLNIGAREGIRYDSSATSVEAYRRGLKAINETAGDDKFLLGCGAPLLASVGLVDGMRVGPDVGGRWVFDPGLPDWPVGNCSVRPAAISSFWSQWMHGHLWQNDPDCLIIRDSPPKYENAFFKRIESDLSSIAGISSFPATPLGLTYEEAGLWIRLIWMMGGMTFLSEVWSELSSERKELYARSFPAHGRKVSVLDWFKVSGAAILAAQGRPFLAGVFNFGDIPCRVAIPAGKLRLSGRWSLRERWSVEMLHGEGNVVVFPELPPHSGRVWEEVS